MPAIAITWLRFNAVGLLGIAVQLAALQLYRQQLGWHYLAATALAVETAVLHNYFWHWKWTWRERQADASSLLRFQCTTGLVSILGNLLAMRLLTGVLGLPVLLANMISISVLYLFNFLVSDRYVFRLR
ncbi:MAG: GtrA family protein [Acidobacteria bacterium]|nr:GtrA family protein [Acidobacteriota bacterium]